MHGSLEWEGHTHIHSTQAQHSTAQYTAQHSTIQSTQHAAHRQQRVRWTGRWSARPQCRGGRDRRQCSGTPCSGRAPRGRPDDGNKAQVKRGNIGSQAPISIPYARTQHTVTAQKQHTVTAQTQHTVTDIIGSQAPIDIQYARAQNTVTAHSHSKSMSPRRARDDVEE